MLVIGRTPIGFLHKGGGLITQFRSLHDLPTLEKYLNQRIFKQNNKLIVDESTIFDSFRSIVKLQENSNSEEKLKLGSLFKKLIESPNVQLNNELILKTIKTLNPPSDLTVQLFRSFNEKYPEQHIDLNIAKLALRKTIYDQINLNDAMDIVNSTTGSSNYQQYIKQQRNISIFKYSSIGVIGLGLLDVGLRSLGLNPRIGVYAMCFSYVFNVFAFGILSFGDKFLPVVDHIEFLQGTSVNRRYLSSDQLRMLSKIAEVDSNLNGIEGFVSKNFANSVKDKGLIPTQPASDELLQEYWLTSGNNFEWIEPDQDPALILWKQRVDGQKPILLKDQLKWTDKLIEGDIHQDNVIPKLKEA